MTQSTLPSSSGHINLSLNDLLSVDTHVGPSKLRRQASQTSSHSAMIPSPRPSSSALPKPAPQPASSVSSASGSRSTSLISTPKILSRRNSSKEPRASGFLGRKLSQKARPPPSRDEFVEESKAMTESTSAEVIETPHVRMDRDPGTGRKMINQYLVLQEIGHGTHGRVRLGQDLSSELAGNEEGEDGLGLGTTYYAIKIVDRNPKRKRLAGLTKQKGLGRQDMGKMVNETEIRKEIAIFKKVNHPNVVRMKEIIDDPESSKLFMILEYCDGGEIRWKIDDGVPALRLDEVRRIFRDTSLGLEYLHHQGIIHRDIKPSNLLLATDGTVKISDFGCSHYSEALQVAASHPGPEGEQYVDDIELAKTAGSPAFFAPEMCYSGFEADSRDLPSPTHDLPALTLRPPSTIEDHTETRASRSDPLVNSPGLRSHPIRPTVSNESSFSRRPDSWQSRSTSASAVQRRERLPITNAIDVWALGVTLYCLLFGKTPFDAANEYQLMQVIPLAEYDVPVSMGNDRILSTSDEGKDALDLLRKLLEKDPGKRISLEQAKKHPFTTRGLSDPVGWLASTDPHAQTFVTVSSDEVAAVVVKSSSFRDKFRKGIRNISNKLQIFSVVSRGRSRSISEDDGGPSTAPSAHSEINPLASPMLKQARHVPLAGEPPVATNGFAARRLSILAGRGTESVPTPRRQSIPSLQSSPSNLPTVTNKTGFVVHREVSRSPIATIPVSSDDGHSPKLLASNSMDRLRSLGDHSPTGSLRRRLSSDVDPSARQRSSSNASSTNLNFGSKLVKLLSRTGSSRSQSTPRDGLSRPDLNLAGSGRESIDEAAPRQSLETFESSSYSSSKGPHSSSATWEPRLHPRPPVRRGSSLSEDLARGVGVDEEEVDWNESLSDDDDYEEPARSILSRSPLVGLDWSEPFPSSTTTTETEQPMRNLQIEKLDMPATPLALKTDIPSHVVRNSPLRPVISPDRARSPLRLNIAEDDTLNDDEGLAISLGSRRGRKGSMADRALRG